MHASRSKGMRAVTILVAAVVALGMMVPAAGAAATQPATAEVTAQMYDYSGVALKVERLVAYDSVIGRLIDGIIINDSSQPMSCVSVKATWPDGQMAEGWPAGQLMPGEWTAFHIDWPDGVPATAGMPAVTAQGSPGDFSHYELTYTDPVLVSAPGASYRSYVTTITNPAENGVPVSSVEIDGYEQDGGGNLADAVFSWFPGEDGIEPGESVEVEFHCKNVAGVSPSVDVAALRVIGKEQPVVTLSADTLSPSMGQTMNLRVDLKRFNGEPILGSRTLKVYYSIDGGNNWEYRYAETETGFVIIPLTITKTTLLKGWFWGDGEYGTAAGGIVSATPRNATTLLNAPSSVRVYRQFKVRGVVKRASGSNGRYVTVQSYKRVGSRWVLKSSVRAYPTASGSFVRSMTLRSRGQWRVRAYRAGAGYTPYRYIRVR